MTSKPRQRGGQAAAKATAETQTEKKAQTQPEAPAEAQPEAQQPAEHAEAQQPAAGGGGDDSGDAPAESAAGVEQAPVASTLPLSGEPQPAQVAEGMARPETGVAPQAFAGGQPDTAAYGDTERNGKALGVPTDTSGELRHVEGAVPTAAFGRTARNGEATEMIEGQTSREFGGNGDPEAKLLNGGVRAEIGAGTGTPAPPDERPTYPSTALTRSSSKAAPTEPGDVTLATQPRLGDPQTSTDPTMAASTLPSMPGDVTVKLVNQKGEEVTPSEFFEVPDGIQGRSFRRVKHRVSEVFTVRKVKTPSRRLLFTEGQMVPVEIAQTLIELHG